jgi:hypothetical protein
VEVVDLIMEAMVDKVVVVLVDIVVARMERVVIMVVEVVVLIIFPNIIMKQVLVERVPLGLFGALEENFQIPLLMINNI